jgi:hypothetical protein
MNSGFLGGFTVREKYHLIAAFPQSGFLNSDWGTEIQQNEDMGLPKRFNEFYDGGRVRSSLWERCLFIVQTGFSGIKKEDSTGLHNPKIIANFS